MGRRFGIGFLHAFVAWLVMTVVDSFIVNIWYNTLESPTFGGAGEQWLYLDLALAVPALNLFLFLLIFAVFGPIVYALRTKPFPRIWPFSVLSILYAVLTASIVLILPLQFALPWIALSVAIFGFALWRYLEGMNRDLAWRPPSAEPSAATAS